MLNKKRLSTAVGDEGGFAPDLGSNEEALQVILEAIEKAGYEPGDDVAHRPRPGGLRASTTRRRSATCSRARAASSRAPRWSDYYAALVDKYPIVSIEDGLAEDDWDGWASS